MSTKLAKFRALSWPERKVLFAATLLLPMFWIGLRVFGLPRFQARLKRSSAVTQTARSDEDLCRIGALVNIAGNHVIFPSTCLTRSLLLDWLLYRRGVNSELRIGVRLVQGRLEAHAWVEFAGKPVNDTQDVAERFAAFDGPLSPESFSSP